MNSYTAVIPVHNGVRTVFEALQSLANQTIPPREILVFDNNSSDGTLKEVKNFAKTTKIPVRIERSSVLLEPNESFAQSIKNVQGRFCWLAADDMLFPWSAEKLLSAKCSKDCQHSIGGSALFLDNTGEPIYGKIYEPELTGVKFLRDPADNSLFYGMHIASVVRDFFPESSYPAWDWGFTFQCLRSFAHIYGPLPTILREYTPMSSHRKHVLTQKTLQKYFPYIALSRSILTLTKMDEKMHLILQLLILNLKGFFLFGKLAPKFEKYNIYFRLVKAKNSLRISFSLVKKNAIVRIIYNFQPKVIKNLIHKAKYFSNDNSFYPNVNLGRMIEGQGAKYRAKLLSLNNPIGRFELVLGERFSTANTIEIIRYFLSSASKNSKLILDLNQANVNFNFIETVMKGLKRVHPDGDVVFAPIKNKEKTCENIEDFYGKIWAHEFSQDLDATLRTFKDKKNKKSNQVNFILSEVPQPNRDAGSIDAIYILSMLKKMGLKVTVFLPHFYTTNPIALKLLRELAEVTLIEEFKSSKAFNFVYGPYAYQYFQQFSLENEFHYIMVDAVFRRAAQNRSELSLSDKNILTFEASAMQNCNYAFCISQRDLESVVERFPSVKAILFPIIRFSRKNSLNKVVNPRKLLFIGSLAHPPNKVAADWIVKELAPQLLLVNKDIELVLAGLGTDMYDRAEINVTGLGLVTDLKELYAETFATIAPMRVAAGINGKVIESLCFRVPAIVSEEVSLNLPNYLLDCCEVVQDIQDYVRIADFMFKHPEKYLKLPYDLKKLNGMSNLKTLNKLLRNQRVDT